MPTDRDLELCRHLGWDPQLKSGVLVSLLRTDPDLEKAMAILTGADAAPAGVVRSPAWTPSTGFVAEPLHHALARVLLGPPQSAIIDACAGSGKTTTVVEMIRMLVNSGVDRDDILYTAHNKAIVQEVKRRLPEGVDAQTTHGLAMRIYRQWNPRALAGDVKPGPRKIYDAARRVAERAIGQANHALPFNAADIAGDLAKLLQMAWMTWPWPDSPHFSAAWCSNMAKERGLELDEPAFSCRLVDAVHQEVVHEVGRFSFDEFLLRVIREDGAVPTYKFIFVDEAQDLNLLQMAFLKRLVRPASGRLVAIGDPEQGIYAWRGADGDALQTISRLFQIHPDNYFRMNRTWRCSLAVVRAANRNGSDIVAAPNAIKGEEINREEGGLSQTMLQLVRAARGGKSGLVVCRVAAPIVALAIELRRELALAGDQVEVMVRGGSTMDEALVLIEQVWTACGGGKRRAMQVSEEMRATRTRAALDQGNTILASQLEDRYSTVQSLIMGAQTLQNLSPVEYAKSLVQDSKAGPPGPAAGRILLSTIHQAKGLEADLVTIFSPELIPHPLVKATRLPGDTAMRQERNLNHVAITRSKDILINQSWPGQSRRYPSLAKLHLELAFKG